MEKYLASMFEDSRHERSLIVILSLTDPDIFKQSKFEEHEMNRKENLALEKLHRQNYMLKEYTVLQ